MLLGRPVPGGWSLFLCTWTIPFSSAPFEAKRAEPCQMSLQGTLPRFPSAESCRQSALIPSGGLFMPSDRAFPHQNHVGKARIHPPEAPPMHTIALSLPEHPIGKAQRSPLEPLPRHPTALSLHRAPPTESAASSVYLSECWLETKIRPDGSSPRAESC